MQITVHVNGASYAREVEPRLLLIHFLRDELRLTGSHWGCDTSNCGACVVWLDEIPVKSCTVLAVMADGRRVLTVEGLERRGVLDPIQQGFTECHGLQCGFCTPGAVRAALPLYRLREHRALRPLGRGASRMNAGADGSAADGHEMNGAYGPVKRKEDARFIRGKGYFVDDIALPGMLHGAILRSPLAHARIVSVDVAAAEAHPRVEAVITGETLAARDLAPAGFSVFA